MAPVGNLSRLVWGGRLFDKESWSCSLHIGGTPAVNLAASTFQAALTAWMTAPGSRCSSAARLDFIKFNDINPITGRYVLQVSDELLQNDMATGVTAPGPAQLSQCVSTRTVLQRGRGHAGRFYPPSGQFVVGSTDGRTSGLIATEAATSAANLIRSINTALAGQGVVVVFSKVGQLVQPITAVRVGRTIDTMRSRRTSMLEDASQVVV